MDETAKLSDVLVMICEKLQLNTCFGVTGGFAMHLNDSFGKSKIKNIYNHHEQASIYSAIGYFKSSNKIPIVSTTAGCGVTNTITGIMDCWQDSVPCLIICGQTNSFKTISYAKNQNIDFRHYSGQDVNIVDIVKSITKYAIELNHDHSQDDIKNIIIETFQQLFKPRYGPVLMSIPINIQSLIITDYKKLVDEIISNILLFKETLNAYNGENSILYNLFNDQLCQSKKPLIIAGGGIKTSLSKDIFYDFITKYNIPVVTTYSAIDIFPSDNPLYMGRIGIYGERCGNFAVQQSDLLIIAGSRMSETTLGYNEHLFNSCKKIVINIDDEIIKINKINVDLFIQRDIHNFINYLPIIDYKIEENWTNLCKIWKTNFFFEKPIINYNKDLINPYDFFEKFANMMPDESIIIPAAGSIFYILRHMIKIKEKTKVVMFSQQDLGYELPAAIGSYFGTKTPIYCFNGDGSIQFNIQELQTIVHYNIPVKIIIFNNHKYGCIEVTQKSYFGNGNTFGINKETGLSFPNFKKIANAYEIDYLYIHSLEQITEIFNEIYDNKPIIIEIEAEYQDRHPKLGMYTDLNGNKVPTPFDKMNPQIA
jgi:acetolactate synthase-1/2/3 large subunit